ncbi:hypothetical protein B0T26DRAFT_753021 [Lasiosphaeria miniovina]|uniref:Uncharacterized protein n=1 Tax=Lasiosphaeria miniovina TaxID=1954250 RepID=A0AA40DTK1_9PEZI|nr:uncharacterized protein B0T26DRAFT_753021 [Lasiosphaeria miniovina]KAK0712837.1 hypothetical protein B0T26DRAFT_753021 [Lasiosphaeria miniovina]
MDTNKPLAVFPWDAIVATGALGHPSTLLLSQVKAWSTYDYYGRLNSEAALADAAAAFVAENSNGDAGLLGAYFRRFLALAREDSAAAASALLLRPAGSDQAAAMATAACWLTVRMSKPTDDFIVPLWHRDGCMFTCTCTCTCTAGPSAAAVPHAKYAVSLLGPGTRVMAPSPQVNKAITASDAAVRVAAEAAMQKEVVAGRAWAWLLPEVDEDRIRADLARQLAGCGEQVGFEPGQVIRFTWGQDDSPVHSEPDLSGGDRVFVSVLFGTEDELRGMAEFREVDYHESVPVPS